MSACGMLHCADRNFSQFGLFIRNPHGKFHLAETNEGGEGREASHSCCLYLVISYNSLSFPLLPPKSSTVAIYFSQEKLTEVKRHSVRSGFAR
jgi:hypothetical protein